MSATLDHLMTPFKPFWRSGVEEIIMNKPHEAWLWNRGKFERSEIDMDADDIEDLGYVAGAQWRQDLSHASPLLGCDLPGEGRLQIVLPPCVRRGFPSLTIRIGDEEWPTLRSYKESGFFEKTRNRPAGLSEVDQELATYFKARDYGTFFHKAVLAKKTIVGIGQTASGKTRFSKALIGEVPLYERLITIEDAAELKNIPHPNRVQMYYNKEAKGNGDGLGPTATQLVEAALRMRIGRLFFQEIRDMQSMAAFLTALQTGHAGGITTLHASSPEDAFDRMKRLAGGGDDALRSIRSDIDIICHFDHWQGERWMSEVWFRPVSDGEIG